MTDKAPERLALEERAGTLELKFPGNIGDEKLAERIAEREAEIAGAANTPAVNGPSSETGNKEPAKNGAGAKSKQKRKDDAAKGGIVTVTGPKKGRRRIGRSFGPEPVEIPAGDLSKADLASLQSDPALVVSIT